MSKPGGVVAALAFAVCLGVLFIVTPAAAQTATTRIESPTPTSAAAATQPTTQAAPALPAPAEFKVIDRPNDAGDALMITWRKMSYDAVPDVWYEVRVATQPDGPFRRLSRVAATGCPKMSDFPGRFGRKAGNADFHALEVTKCFMPDAKAPGGFAPAVLKYNTTYYVKLAVTREGKTLAETAGVGAIPRSNWIAWQKMNIFIAMILVSAAILYFVNLARRNPSSIYIRRIAGLEAVEESLGRATEMGKPVFFCHGLGGVGDVVTISALNMLGKLSERVAEYGADMKVTCNDYLVMQVSQEMVREACVRVGRPDAYREDNISYVADTQFAYATAVEGMLLREKPATCFFFGQFMAEALLLSETGAVTKAIQIAGTDVWSQIPFFITTCDYTLIGEEMYAASAYLSREPR
ncbi:MAG: hypothetical protein PHU85_12150, partial [Phycisphaerae bacterium]|nr:hypothetical protein [Phycisphaerae bacterium]